MQLRWLLVATLGSFAGPAIQAEPSALVESCRRLPGHELTWVHTGEWEGRRLVLGDTGAGQLAVLDVSSLQWTKVSHPGEGPLEFTAHGVLPSDQPGVLVTTGRRLVLLNEALRPVQGFDLRQAVEKSLDVLLVFGALGADGQLLASGEVVSTDRASWRGLFRVRLTPKLEIEVVRELSPDSNEFRFYNSLLGFGAVRKGRVHWMVMDSPAFILELTPKGSRKLDIVPPAFRVVPISPQRGGASTLRADYSALEKLSFPAGLYAMGEELFILHHEAGDTGPTWRLAAVDPDRPAEHRLLTLPTRSPWITVVPGPEYWAILEQGPVLGPGTQTTSAVLLVPSKWFSAPDSPLTRPGAATACPKPPSR